MGPIPTPCCRLAFVVVAAAVSMVWPVDSHSHMRDTGPALSKNTHTLSMFCPYPSSIECWTAPSSSSTGTGCCFVVVVVVERHSMNYRVSSPALFSLAFAFLFDSI